MRKMSCACILITTLILFSLPILNGCEKSVMYSNFETAKKYYDHNQWDIAENILFKEYQTNGANREMKMMLGKCYLQGKKNNQLKEFASNIISTNDKDVGYYFMAIIHQNENKTPEAMESLNHAIEHNPIPEYHLFKVKLLISQGRFREARSSLDSIKESNREKTESVIYDEFLRSKGL